MKRMILLSFLALGSKIVGAQEYQEISTGAGYGKQSYISLSGGQEKQVDNAAWDIAFAASPFDVGIFINESAGSSMGMALPTIELYDAQTENFGDQPDPATLTGAQLFNSEESWSEGAFNENYDPTNPFDFGWGIYDPATHVVSGDKVYVLKLRSGEYRKVQIQSLSGSVFTFRYANLDGSNEATKTIDKAAQSGKTLAYFSFTSGSTVDVEPAGGFDLVYLRYITPLYDPSNMVYIPYAVTGILSGSGVEVARADGVDPSSATFAEWEDSLATELDAIGYDWKSFSGTAWSLDGDLVYFVKTAEGRIWKIQFVDFEGSTTGTTVFEKTDLGLVNAVGDQGSPLSSFNVFPNPVGAEANVVFSLQKPAVQKAALSLHDATGRLVFQENLIASSGLNGHILNTTTLQNGFYFLCLEIDGAVFSQKIIVAKR